MTESVAFSQLSATLEHFNKKLDKSNKLDAEALKTIQDYLTDPEVTIQNKDEKKMQRALKQLELLDDEVTIARVSPTIIDESNYQLINLAKSITKYGKKIKTDPLFVVIKLEVCFLEILSEEEHTYNKQKQKQYDVRWNKTVSFKTAHASPRSHASYMDHQQPLINELMNAVLFDVIKYFQKENKSFTEYVTEQFLDSLNEKAKNPDIALPDETSNYVYNSLTKTAAVCNLSMTFLILNLQYAIIGFGKRHNAFTIPLKNYIRSTQSPSLKEFNKTIGLSSALSSEDVDQFEPLFNLYRRILLNDQSDEEQRQASNVSEFELPAPPIKYERELKGVWIKPNSQLEDCGKDLKDIMNPGELKSYSARELKSEIPDDWEDSRIFLCLSAKQAHDVLPRIHKEDVLYRIYVLCENETEEAEFQKEKNKFNKIRVITSNTDVFLREFALDILPSFVELGDMEFDSKKYGSAKTLFEAVRDKVIKYDAGKKFSLSEIRAKIEQCSPPLKD